LSPPSYVLTFIVQNLGLNKIFLSDIQRLTTFLNFFCG
jgi:hypothetical protein